jgi:hypothetical protein
MFHFQLRSLGADQCYQQQHQLSPDGGHQHHHHLVRNQMVHGQVPPPNKSQLDNTVVVKKVDPHDASRTKDRRQGHGRCFTPSSGSPLLPTDADDVRMKVSSRRLGHHPHRQRNHLIDRTGPSHPFLQVRLYACLFCAVAPSFPPETRAMFDDKDDWHRQMDQEVGDWIGSCIAAIRKPKKLLMGKSLELASRVVWTAMQRVGPFWRFKA